MVAPLIKLWRKGKRDGKNKKPAANSQVQAEGKKKLSKDKNLRFIKKRNGETCWYVDVTFGYKRIRRFGGFSKAEALNYLADLRRAARDGKLDEFLGRAKKETRFADYGRNLLDSKEWKEKRSAERNEYSFQNLKAFFGDCKLNEINPALVRRYINKRADEGASNATINREITLLKSILYQAEYDGIIESNPIRGRRVSKLPENNNRERVILEMKISDDDLRRLIDCCSERIRPIIILALTTGMRRNEILKMRWKDIDFRLLTIRIPAEHSKTKQERIIPIPAELAAMLDDLPRKGERVFEGIKDIRGSFASALKKAEISGNLHFHDLRHLAAYRLVKMTDIMTAARILGHNDLKTTMRYLFSTEKDKREAIEKSWESLVSGRQKDDIGAGKGLLEDLEKSQQVH